MTTSRFTSITVKPAGGLCNRFRAIDSAIAFAEHHNIPVAIAWESLPELNCPIDQLLALPTHFVVHSSTQEAVPSFTRRQFPRSTYEGNRITRAFQRYFLASQKNSHVFLDEFAEQSSRIRSPLSASEMSSFDRSMEEWFATRIQRCSGDLFVSSCYRFFPNPQAFAWLTPSQHIQQRLAIIAATTDASRETIGIHIRRTDQLESIAQSPLQLFERAILKELKLNSRCRFFIATDDAETKTRLKALFGEETILTVDSELSRDRPNGVVDAMIELMLLASTKRIYGSFWSTFSQTASIIGNTELIVLCKDNGVDV